MHVFALGLLISLTLGSAAGAEERLALGRPSGFVLGAQSDTAIGETREYVPAGQTVETWTEMATYQRFPGNAGEAPEAFLQRMLDVVDAACPGAVSGEIKSGLSGPFPYGMVEVTCPLNPATGQPEVFIARAISGRDRMYVVQYAWRRIPTAAERAAARAWMGHGGVCDTRGHHAPCPV